MKETMRYLGGGMEERWNELAVAIIEQAISDFRNGGPKAKADVTTFFLSGWFKTLSGGADGRKVLERLWREDAS